MTRKTREDFTERMTKDVKLTVDNFEWNETTYLKKNFKNITT